MKIWDIKRAFFRRPSSYPLWAQSNRDVFHQSVAHTGQGPFLYMYVEVPYWSKESREHPPLAPLNVIEWYRNNLR